MAEGQDETRQAVSAGQVLREARERQGLSVQDAADGLNLKPRVIQAIEEDRYDLLPPRTFVKGYLRAYAKLVGVKEYDVLAAFEHQQPEPEPDRVQPAVPAAEHNGAVGLLKWIVVAVALIVLAYVAYNTYVPRPDQPSSVGGLPPATQQPDAATGGPTGIQPPSEEAVEELAVTEAERAGEPSVPPPQEPVAAVAEQPASPSAEVTAEENVPPQAQAQDQQQPAPTVARPEPPAAATAGLVISVNGESWLEVQDANGVRRFASLVQGSRTIRVDGTPPFTLLVGNAADVEVRYEGQPVALQPYRRGRVARLTVPATPQ